MGNQIRNLYKVDYTSFDYIYEENVDIPLRLGEGLVRCNVYRPKSESARYPVLVTYGPYGKDIHYSKYVYLKQSDGGSDPVLAFTQILTVRCRKSIVQHIRPGRRPTRGFGQNASMQSSGQMRGVAANPPGCLTPCHQERPKRSSMSSNGPRASLGPRERSGCWASATTPAVSGEWQRDGPKAWPVSSLGRVCRITTEIDVDTEVSCRTRLSASGGIVRLGRVHSIYLCPQRY